MSSLSQSSKPSSSLATNSTENSPIGNNTLETAAQNHPTPKQCERRMGVEDRRQSDLDRRNEDRVHEELLPRRNSDLPDRRLI